MPTTTVPMCPVASPLDYDRTARLVTEVLDAATRLPSELAAGHLGELSQLLGAAALLHLAAGDRWGHTDLTEIADRLWMIGGAA